MTISMTQADINRFIEDRLKDGSKTLKDLEAGNATLERAVAAKQRLARLRSDPAFVKKYAAGDVDAVDAVRILTMRQAEGLTVLDELSGGGDVNQRAQSVEALRQEGAAMASDPEFAKKLQAGDQGATRAMREHNERLAASLGVDPRATPVGQSPSPQAAPAVNPSAEGSGE